MSSATTDGSVRTRDPDDDGRSFFVLLGSDYSGKSSTMSRLAETAPEWHFVSVDPVFLGPEHAQLERLRRELGDTAAGLHSHFSLDFAMTLMQTSVIHLRDEIDRCPPDARIVVDSYYYKVLAKYRLLGGDDWALAQWWRTFPRPRGVFLLDVPPREAWRRSGSGAELNRFEHYGATPARDAFEAFQRDLRAALMTEVRGLPVRRMDATAEIATTTATIKEVIARVDR